MRDPRRRLIRILLATSGLLGPAVAARAQDPVVVQNEASAPVPVVPASGPTAVQSMQSVGDAAVFRLGPFPAGKQVALTALTVASPTMAGFAPNPHAKDVIFYTVPAAPSRVGDPTCSPYASGEKLLTFVTVRANDTAHASYTQPLMAPVDPPQTPWCLIAQAINGWVYVTAIGYIKQP